jgi:hypothetical protein
MAIKFEKVKAGMTLYDRHSYKMGNTTLRSIGEWTVYVISVDPEKRTAECSWNGNRAETYRERDIRGLYDWSMHDDCAEVKRGLCDSVVKVTKKKTHKKEAK